LASPFRVLVVAIPDSRRMREVWKFNLTVDVSLANRHHLFRKDTPIAHAIVWMTVVAAELGFGTMDAKPSP
jgi:hypothetical protein